MSLVWYTTAELADGVLVNTNDYCHVNRSALSRATQEQREVEDLLAEVRDAEFPKAPRRICSFLVVPWPTKQPTAQGEGEVFREGVEYEAVPEPPGSGTYCYRVVPGPKGQRWMADEGIIDILVRKWGRISAQEAWEAARAYWSSEIWHSVSYLLAGDVRVIQRCAAPTFR